MSWVAVAVVGGAVIGGVASNVAAGTQASAQKQASNTQLGMFNTLNSQEQPYIQAGYGATSKLNDLLGTSGNTSASGYGSLTSSFTAQDYLNNQDPGYQFQLQQGASATRNADTPGVGALSGAALKDLTNYNQNYASTGYQNAYNRYNTTQNNIFSRLSGIATIGQNAAGNVGTSGTSLATGAAQSQAASGASTASGINSAGTSIGNSVAMAGLINGNTTSTTTTPTTVTGSGNWDGSVGG